MLPLKRTFFKWAARCLLVLELIVVPLYIILLWLSSHVFPATIPSKGPVASDGLGAGFLFFYLILVLPALFGGIVQVTLLWFAMSVVMKFPVRLAAMLSTLVLPLLFVGYLVIVRAPVWPIFIPPMVIPIGLALLIYGMFMPLPPGQLSDHKSLQA